MNKLEHLKIIQSIISRMAGNSFLLKGWCVTLVSAILALAAKEPNKLFIAVAVFPVLMFWILDGYFLYQERLFRDLYSEITAIPDDNSINFVIDTTPHKVNQKWWGAAFSSTLSLFYITMLISVIIIFFLAFGYSH